MSKRYWIVFLLLISITIHYAQKDSVYYGEPDSKKKSNYSSNDKKPKPNYRDRLIYGGNFSLLFGTYTLISLSPGIGYKVTENFHAGGGIIYYYSSYVYGGRRQTQSLYGTSLFARYFVNNSLYLQVQYDRLNQNNYLVPNYKNERIWVDYFMVGGGYRQPLGAHSALMASVMWNLTPSPLSIYYNPYFTMGIIAGF